MKFGYNTLTWANFYKNYDIKQPISEIGESGFEGVEFVEPLSRLGDKEKLLGLLAEKKLKPASLSCGLNMDPKDRRDIEGTNSRIEFASQLGIKNIMLCGGWRSNGVEKSDKFYKIL